MTASWERVCRVDEVHADRPLGRVVGDSGQDRDRVCVVPLDDGRYAALLDRCPHRDIALSGGLVKDGDLVCPGHFWRFDLGTGQRRDQPGQPLSFYPTRVVDGWIEAQLPPPALRRSTREWLLAEAAARRPQAATAVARPEPTPEIGDSIPVGDVATNYHDEGSGPPVVLLHGSGPGVSAWANWRLTIAHLAQRFRVLAPDILGFGYTQRPAGIRYNLDTWTEHLVGFLDALGLAKVDLVGNSFGGALALSLATRHPERVRKMVLMGSAGVPFELTPSLDAVWGFEPSLPAMRGLLEIFAHDQSLVSDDLAQLRLTAATRPGVHEAYRSMFPTPRQNGVDALTIDEALLHGLPHETLIVHGRDDQVIPMSTSLRLLEVLDRSQLHVFGRSGHWVQIEHASEFNELLTTFLSD